MKWRHPDSGNRKARHWLKGNDPTPVVDCSANGVVKSWDINRCAYDRPENDYKGDGMQYDYTCADTVVSNCETLTTDCSYIANTHPDDQHTGFLMPHDVKCSQPNSFLTKFGMKFCSDTSFQYEYQCCQGTGPDFGNMCDDGNGYNGPDLASIRVATAESWRLHTEPPRDSELTLSGREDAV